MLNLFQIFLINEHPQTIAVILAHLEPEKKGEVLKDYRNRCKRKWY